ncbi:hypothetical protein SPRG_04122, partial [Saprolegnia parasitica CBS 223.65]
FDNVARWYRILDCRGSSTLLHKPGAVREAAQELEPPWPWARNGHNAMKDCCRIVGSLVVGNRDAQIVQLPVKTRAEAETHNVRGDASFLHTRKQSTPRCPRVGYCL